jgi:hypothetical protein
MWQILDESLPLGGRPPTELSIAAQSFADVVARFGTSMNPDHLDEAMAAATAIESLIPDDTTEYSAAHLMLELLEAVRDEYVEVEREFCEEDDKAGEAEDAAEEATRNPHIDPAAGRAKAAWHKERAEAAGSAAEDVLDECDEVQYRFMCLAQAFLMVAESCWNGVPDRRGF